MVAAIRYILVKREEHLREHEGSCKNNTITSKFADHAVHNKHSFNLNFKTLHRKGKGLRFNALESLEIT